MTGPAWFLLPAAVFIALGLLGLRWERIQLKLYRTWNRTADFVRKAGFRWTLYLSHSLLLRAIGPEGSKFDPPGSPSNATGWTPYEAGFGSHMSPGQRGPIDQVTTKIWTRHYFEWSRHDHNRWALLLLPFLLMLSLFSKDEENSAAPSNIYTLF